MHSPSLTPSDNSKVKFRTSHYNTFGLNFGLLSDGGTCPGATQGAGGCLDVRTGKKRETCYMAKVVQIYKAVGTILDNNTKLIKDKPKEEITQVLINTFQNFVDRNEKKYWFYRITYSGDIVSREFAEALVEACTRFPEVKFWLYTRSFTKQYPYADILVKAPNLAVYLSLDPVNKLEGLEVYNRLKDKFNNIGLAHLSEPVNIDNVKFVPCPETYGKISNTAKRGACAACRLCFTYNDKIKLRAIKFKLH